MVRGNETLKRVLRGRGRCGGRECERWRLRWRARGAASLTFRAVVHNGNLTLDDVQETAKQMRHKSFARHFSGTVKEMLGTCVSIGCTVDGKDPREICRMIDEGDIVLPEYDVEPSDD